MFKNLIYFVNCLAQGVVFKHYKRKIKLRIFLDYQQKAIIRILIHEI